MIRNNSKKLRSFKSKENIHKKEFRPYHGFGYYSLISDPINLAKGARGKYCEFASSNNGSRFKSNRKAMNRNWSNQNTNPILKIKAGNKYVLQIDKIQ